jgi:tellurite resistance protein
MRRTRTQISMDQSDIEYVIELLNDAISEKDWDKVEEARETMKEFLDTNDPPEDE